MPTGLRRPGVYFALKAAIGGEISPPTMKSPSRRGDLAGTCNQEAKRYSRFVTETTRNKYVYLSNDYVND